MNEQDKAVVDYLESIGVEFYARLLGETKRDNDWTCDEWRVSFQRVRLDSRLPVRDKAPLEAPYYTGTGHRKSAQPMPADLKKCNPLSIAVDDWKRANLKPVAPTAASVLHSLLLDAQCAEQPFDYFCDDLGYDQDSRKALAVYDACIDIRRQVDAFFTLHEREQLRAMLEDY